MDASSYPYKLKLHDKLDTPDECVTEYNKEAFLQYLREQVSYYVLQMFFFIPTSDKTMNNLALNYYLFEIDTIINKYESRLINPDTVLKENNHETQESIQHLFCANDVYKLFDKALSHLVIEFLLLTSFSEFIKRHFSK